MYYPQDIYERIGTPEADRALIRFLKSAVVPLTVDGSLF